jgi:adenylylsulfate reductase subunit B
MPPQINDRCIRCGNCYDVCPGDVFEWPDREAPPRVLYPDECWHCGACRLECPEEAIQYVFPLRMTHV